MSVEPTIAATKAAEAIQKHEGIDDDADADERRSAWAAIIAAHVPAEARTSKLLTLLKDANEELTQARYRLLAAGDEEKAAKLLTKLEAMDEAITEARAFLASNEDSNDSTK
jgi:hypothetical protein